MRLFIILIKYKVSLCEFIINNSYFNIININFYLIYNKIKNNKIKIKLNHITI